MAKTNSNRQPYDGRSRLPEFHIWKDCRKIANRRQREGVDLRVCKGWDRFNQFILDVGKRPSPDHCFCRIDKAGHFSCGHCEECVSKGWPANCEWTIWIDDCQRRTNVVNLTHDGVTLGMQEWGRRTRLGERLIWKRLDEGWSVEATLTTPVDRLANQPLRVPDGMVSTLAAEYAQGKTIAELARQAGFGRAAIRAALIRSGTVIKKKLLIRRGSYKTCEELAAKADLDLTRPDKRFKDLTGHVFDKLTVVKYAGRKRLKSGTVCYWFCECECGGSTLARSNNLLSGMHRSCGCLAESHKHPLYTVWCSLIRRCEGMLDYLNRTPCEGIRSFAGFVETMGARPKGRSIDRIDNSKGYWCGECDECQSKSQQRNVRWADSDIQSNNRSTNHLLTFNGKIQTIAQWRTELKIPRGRIERRLLLGWSIEKALTTPVQVAQRPLKELSGEPHQLRLPI